MILKKLVHWWWTPWAVLIFSSHYSHFWAIWRIVAWFFLHHLKSTFPFAKSSSCTKHAKHGYVALHDCSPKTVCKNLMSPPRMTCNAYCWQLRLSATDTFTSLFNSTTDMMLSSLSNMATPQITFFWSMQQCAKLCTVVPTESNQEKIENDDGSWLHPISIGGQCNRLLISDHWNSFENLVHLHDQISWLWLVFCLHPNHHKEITIHLGNDKKLHLTN